MSDSLCTWRCILIRLALVRPLPKYIYDHLMNCTQNLYLGLRACFRPGCPHLHNNQVVACGTASAQLLALMLSEGLKDLGSWGVELAGSNGFRTQAAGVKL